VLAILIQACRDAANGHSEQARIEAMSWISSGGEDFCEYCEYIGYDPIRFRKSVLNKLKELRDNGKKLKISAKKG